MKIKILIAFLTIVLLNLDAISITHAAKDGLSGSGEKGSNGGASEGEGGGMSN